jgi:hypothetical protein
MPSVISASFDGLDGIQRTTAGQLEEGRVDASVGAVLTERDHEFRSRAAQMESGVTTTMTTVNRAAVRMAEGGQEMVRALRA